MNTALLSYKRLNIPYLLYGVPICVAFLLYYELYYNHHSERNYWLIPLIAAFWVSSLFQINTITINDKIFECRYWLSKKKIEISVSQISRVWRNVGSQYTAPAIHIQMMDGNLIEIQTNDASSVASILGPRVLQGEACS